MKKIIFIIITLLQLVEVNGQKKFSEGNVESLFKINFLSPGIAYEAPLSKKITLYSELYSTINLSIRRGFSSVNGSNNEIKVYLLPIINEQLRFYYNGEKRNEKNKRVEKNSMNYLAASAFFMGGNKNNFLTSEIQFGFLWGLHRNQPKGFSLDLNIGPGIALPTSTNNYLYTNTQTRFVLFSDVKIGIWLGKRS
jgi:hypothetical protein